MRRHARAAGRAPVQVLPERVDAEVAERDAVGVDDGHELEDEAAAQRGGARVGAAQEEEEHAVEEEIGRAHV